MQGMGQKLSIRLQAVADFVTPGSVVADIGTDHGFLPIYLVEKGICPRAVAMDIRQGPLERAREHIAAAGLNDRIQVRLSDGLNGLMQNEADSAVIAGMGGLTVIHILEQAQEKLADFKEMVLEPQSDPAKVRSYVREHRMWIDREDLVYESGKFYPVLHVCTKQEPAGEQARCKARLMQIRNVLLEKLGEEARVQQLFDTYGEYVIDRGHPALKKMLVRDQKRALEILQALSKREHTQDAADARKREVKMRLEEIRLLLETEECLICSNLTHKD